MKEEDFNWNNFHWAAELPKERDFNDFGNAADW